MGTGGGSIQLGRISGIRIGASPSWFFVLFLGIYLMTGYFSDVIDGSSTEAFALAVAAALLFFGSLILHELGHALVARRNGIGIAGIDLIFFGGVAKLTQDADTPGVEFRVAAAGPLVTVVIVAVCLAVSAISSHAGDVIDTARFLNQTTTPVYALLGWLASINVLLLAFNLVPAFPLDGGRIARAAAWRITGSRHRGTRFAGLLGQGFAILLIGVGIFWTLGSQTFNGLYTVFIGLALYQSARGAVVSSALSERLGAIAAADVMDREAVTMPAETTAVAAEEEFFLRYGYPWFPVVGTGGRYAGVLRRERVEAAIGEGRPVLAVADLVEEPTEHFRVGIDQPLQALLSEPGLRELGALVAVDAEGVVCGVVTLDQVRQALVDAGPDQAARATPDL